MDRNIEFDQHIDEHYPRNMKGDESSDMSLIEHQEILHFKPDPERIFEHNQRKFVCNRGCVRYKYLG